METSEVEKLVREAYSEIATRPNAGHPLPVGHTLALDLGYTQAVLDTVPGTAVEAFSGVSNVSMWADIKPGDDVLDLGCGGGLDTLIALNRGANVVAVDFSAAMLERARAMVESAGKQDQVKFLEARADQLPLPDSSFDAVMINGIFNLNPRRQAILAEIHRVLRPGGRVYAAEIVRKTSAPSVEPNIDNWVA